VEKPKLSRTSDLAEDASGETWLKPSFRKDSVKVIENFDKLNIYFVKLKRNPDEMLKI